MNEPAPGRMDMGDIVAGAWNIYRRAPLTWLALTAVSFLVVFVSQWAVGDRLDLGADPSNEQLQESLPAVGAVLGATIVVDLFTHIALVAAAFMAMQSKVVRVREAYATGARLFLVILAGSLVTGLVAGLLGATLILLPLAIYFFISWSLLVQVVVNEGSGPLRALSRSRQIVRGQWWRTLGINLAIVLLGFLPGFAIGRISAAVGHVWFSALGAALGSVLAAPFIGVAQTLLYADLRARKGEQPLAAPVGEVR